MLIGSVRELVRGRRPVWLATWLPGAFACALFFIHHLNGDPTLRASAVLVRVLSAFALLTGLAVRSWLKAILPTSVAAVACAGYILVMQHHDGPMAAIETLAIPICAVVLLVFIARGLFEAHTYGNEAHASLCLLSFFTLRFIVSGAGVPMGPAGLAVVQVLCGASVVVFARVPGRRGKALAAYIALLFSTIQNCDMAAAGSITVVGAAALLAGFCWIAVMWPMQIDEPVRAQAARA